MVFIDVISNVPQLSDVLTAGDIADLKSLL